MYLLKGAQNFFSKNLIMMIVLQITNILHKYLGKYYFENKEHVYS